MLIVPFSRRRAKMRRLPRERSLTLARNLRSDSTEVATFAGKLSEAYRRNLSQFLAFPSSTTTTTTTAALFLLGYTDAASSIRKVSYK